MDNKHLMTERKDLLREASEADATAQMLVRHALDDLGAAEREARALCGDGEPDPRAVLRTLGAQRAALRLLTLASASASIAVEALEELTVGGPLVVR